MGKAKRTAVAKYPEIGLDNAKAYLHDVLRPAYQQFTERGTRANLLQVAQAAWAIHERLWHDKGCVPPLEQFRADLFKACPVLRLMRDIAETGKHTGLKREVPPLSLFASRVLKTRAGPWRSDGPTY
jgi:hypothetical protein